MKLIFTFLILLTALRGESQLLLNQHPNLRYGLVGWWTMNATNADGSLTDSSGFGNTGTNANGVTLIPGVIGNAASFNGSSSYVAVNGTFLPTTVLSTTCWVKLATNSGYVGFSIFDKTQTGDSAFFRFGLSGSNNTLFTWNGTQAATGTIVISTNQWTFVATTITSSSTKFYVNGVFDTTTAIGLGTVNSGNFLIGRDSHNPANFNGLIDDVRIYNRALSATEVQQLYNGGRGTP